MTQQQKQNQYTHRSIKNSYIYESEEVIDNMWESRRKEEVIPLLIGGQIELKYIEPEGEESPWDDNNHNGPQAA